MDIYRTFYPNTKEYTFFYYVSDISPILTTGFNQYKKIEITFCIHYDLKPEINKTEMAESIQTNEG